MSNKLIASGSNKDWHVEIESNNDKQFIAFKSDNVWIHCELASEVKEVYDFLKSDEQRLVVGTFGGQFDVELEHSEIGGWYLNVFGPDREDVMSIILRKNDIEQIKKCFEEINDQMVKSADTQFSKNCA